MITIPEAVVVVPEAALTRELLKSITGLRLRFGGIALLVLAFLSRALAGIAVFVLRDDFETDGRTGDRS